MGDAVEVMNAGVQLGVCVGLFCGIALGLSLAPAFHSLAEWIDARTARARGVRGE